MAYYNILDIGFVSRPDSGTQLSAQDRVNEGEELALKNITIGITNGNNFDNSPELNNFTQSKVSVSTIENDVIQITGIIKTNDATDRLRYYHLTRLTKTVGYKLLYYKSLDTTEKFENQIITLLAGYGSSNTHVFSAYEQGVYGIDDAYYFVPVRFNDLQTQQSGDNPDTITFTLSGVIIPYS